MLSEKSRVPTSKVGISSGNVKSSCPKPKILDPRVYSYDEMIECREKLCDSHKFEFIISPVETDFKEKNFKIN